MFLTGKRGGGIEIAWCSKAYAERDRDQSSCAEAVRFGNRRGIDEEVSGFGEELHGAIAVHASEPVAEAEAKASSPLIG